MKLTLLIIFKGYYAFILLLITFSCLRGWWKVEINVHNVQRNYVNVPINKRWNARCCSSKLAMNKLLNVSSGLRDEVDDNQILLICWHLHCWYVNTFYRHYTCSKWQILKWMEIVTFNSVSLYAVNCSSPFHQCSTMQNSQRRPLLYIKRFSDV